MISYNKIIHKYKLPGFSLFLFCFVLFCFVLFCFVLFCFVLFCFEFKNILFRAICILNEMF